MAFRLLKNCILAAFTFCIFCVGSAYAYWQYFSPSEPLSKDFGINIEDWIFLPEGNQTTELGASYTGLLEVILNDLRFGINPGGLIREAFGDKKLLEPHIVHSAQNNLSGGNLNNALSAANAQNLQFVVQEIEGKDPMEYYAYMFERVRDKGQIVNVYKVHLCATATEGSSKLIYTIVDTKFGQAETYVPVGGKFVSVKPGSWQQISLPAQ